MKIFKNLTVIIVLLTVGLVSYKSDPVQALRQLFVAEDLMVSSYQQTVTYSAVDPSEVLEGKPARIEVPSLGIDNLIENGVYDSKTHSWNLSQVNAHHAESSAMANVKGGNTFIYGHNNWNIFGKLSRISPGEQVIIETVNNLKFYYQLVAISEVKPDDVQSVDYSGPPILTIQTCSGNWNEKRQMFRFKLLRVEEPAMGVGRQ